MQVASELRRIHFHQETNPMGTRLFYWPSPIAFSLSSQLTEDTIWNFVVIRKNSQFVKAETGSSARSLSSRSPSSIISSRLLFFQTRAASTREEVITVRMGLFGYTFVNLTSEEVHARRILLDHYALIAQCSVIAIIATIQVGRLSSWLSGRYGRGDEEQMPSSPYLKASAKSSNASWTRLVSRSKRKVQWWLGNDIRGTWGTNAQWIFGSLWLTWLLFLCIKDTGSGMWSGYLRIPNSELSFP